jgi:hypothetical protein
VEDVSERPFVGFAVFVELRVGGLHLYLHVLEETVLPLSGIHVLSFLRYERTQGFQVPVLLHSLFRLFLLRNNFTFGRHHISFVPPLVLVFCFGCWLLLVRMVVVFILLLLDVHRRREGSDSIEIFVVSESHQHRVLMNLWDRLLG